MNIHSVRRACQRHLARGTGTRHPSSISTSSESSSRSKSADAQQRQHEPRPRPAADARSGSAASPPSARAAPVNCATSSAGQRNDDQHAELLRGARVVDPRRDHDRRLQRHQRRGRRRRPAISSSVRGGDHRPQRRPGSATTDDAARRTARAPTTEIASVGTSAPITLATSSSIVVIGVASSGSSVRACFSPTIGVRGERHRAGDRRQQEQHQELLKQKELNRAVRRQLVAGRRRTTRRVQSPAIVAERASGQLGDDDRDRRTAAQATSA